MPFHAEIERWLTCHHGVIGRRRAMLLGMSEGAIRARVATGEWVVAHPGVYVRAASERTEAQRHFAAVVWGGPGARAIGASAMWLWGCIDVAPVPVHVGVPAYRGRPPFGVRATRLASVPPTVLRQGIPTLDLPQALVSFAACADDAELRRVLDKAVADRPGIATTALRALAPPGPMAGRKGAARLRRAIEHGGYLGTTRSTVGESALVRLAAAAGIPRPVREHEVIVEGHRFKLDCAHPDILFTYEFDGYADHHTPAQHRYDAWRRRLLARAEWTVRVYTWHDVTSGADDLACELGDDYRAAAKRHADALVRAEGATRRRA